MLQETIVNKKQLQKTLDALIELIDDWNQLAVDEDRGPNNHALCLVLWDDGSGSLGKISHRPDTLIKQAEFDTPAELVNYLADWLKYDERDLEAARQESQAEIERLRSILDEADERAKIIEERLDNVIAGNGQLIAELDEWRAGNRRLGVGTVASISDDELPAPTPESEAF